MNKRIVFVFSIIILCFSALILRVGFLSISTTYSASERKSTRTVIVGKKRGNIYDRNYSLLVNEKEKLISVVTPCIPSADYLYKYMSKDELSEKIEKGFPFTIETKEKINNQVIRTFSVPERYSDASLARHIIGYTNSDGEGVCGIEKSFDEFLKSGGGTLSVTFDADARGRILAGNSKRINDNGFSSKSGVVLTIDKNIQKAAETALKSSKIKSGCAVVLSAQKGEILALASIPDFDPNNIPEYLDKENSPFLNKALLPYACGSVFKPLVCAAALENGIDPDFTFRCTGEITVGDKTFSCYNHKSHGKVDMEKALCCSCNTYFVNLIMNMDSDLLLSLCEKVGIEREDILCEGIIGKAGRFPLAEELKSKGELANFSFGQGKLLMTPLKMAEIYSLLSTGNFTEASLIKGISNYMGLMKAEKEKAFEKLLSDSTVVILRKMLKSVVYSGAKNAKSKKLSLCGKTGTAQSGIFLGEREVLRTWFAGFFPFENPKYVVVVMDENGNGGNADCAPVFKKICEEIDLID